MISAVDAARAVAAAHSVGRELVTITVTSGGAAGARYLSHAAGQLEGSISTELDQLALALAEQAWQTRAPVFAEPLFAELHALAEPLLIFGAGHIAVPLASITSDLGFQVTVLDDRDEFAQPARFAEAVQVQTLDFAEPLRGVEISSRTFVIMLTRAHKYDFDCLRAVLALPERPRYIGMIGSKRRVRAAFKALLDGGVARAQLAPVPAPVGLAIGAETPAEIAVSIAAELVQVRRHAQSLTMGSQASVLDRMLPENAAQ